MSKLIESTDRQWGKLSASPLEPMKKGGIKIFVYTLHKGSFFPDPDWKARTTKCQFREFIRIEVQGKDTRLIAIGKERFSKQDLVSDWEDQNSETRDGVFKRNISAHWSGFRTKTPDCSPKFLLLAQSLTSFGRVDAALDIIYRAIDDLMTKGELENLNSILENIDISRYSSDIWLAILTATLPVKSKLPSRKAFFQTVERELIAIGENEPGLLAGLE